MPVLQAFLSLARSSTFWLGLIANLAAFLSTGEVSTTLLVAAVAGYTAKEGMRYVSERPTAPELELELELERMPKPTRPSPGATIEESAEIEGYDRLFSTRVRPMLRQLREARRRQLTGEVPDEDRRTRRASF